MDNKIQTSAELAEAAALPRCHAVHTDPDMAQGAALVPEAMAKKTVAQKSPAEWAYERLILYIKNFEEQLDSDHEVAMGFTGGDAGVLKIEGLGFFDPDVVTFYGTDAAGTKTQLIQHVSQLSVMLRALPKEIKAEAPRRIGFKLAAGLEEK